jgi:hypothetical protein
MRIRIDSAEPCHAATLLRTYVYRDRNLWLHEAAGDHEVRVVIDDRDAAACVSVSCGDRVLLGEAIAAMLELPALGDTIEVRRSELSDAVLRVAVPLGKGDDVARALFRALSRLARPTQQPGPAPVQRRWFSRH